MNKRLKAKWVKALRSGEIKQARAALLTESGGMCCIGVLGRLCGLSDKFLLENAGAVGGVGFGALEREIPRHVVDILVEMNDGKKWHGWRSFKQIAAYIARTPRLK